MHDEHKNQGMEWGPEEVTQILDVVGEKIPALLEKLSDILYSKENAEKYGDAVATFYTRLIEAGMEPDQAYALTEKYMSSLSPMDSMGKAFGKASNGNHHGGLNLKIE